jgi:type I restriction enzyme S subunit
MADIRQLAIPEVPALPTQQRIAAVLSAFDELIEINERRIELLEDLARSLHREWFLRFRFPGHEKVELVDSELGPIPEGWSVVALSELVTTQYGLTASASQAVVGPKFLRGMDINKRSFVDWAAVPYCRAAEEEVAKFGLRAGDVCIIRMADPGKVGIVEKPVDAVFASYLVRLRPVDTRLSPYLLFHHLDSPEYQDWITGSSTGATRKSASAKVLTEPSVVVPTPEIASAFESHASEVRRSLTSLVETNAALAATRDLLLPRLVTGRLDISDIDLGDLLPAEAA